jgi:PA14 domain
MLSIMQVIWSCVTHAQAYFDIPIPFSKFFQLNSTDGSRLFIDDDLVVDHAGLHEFIGSATQKWPLNGPKRFKMTIQYFKVSDHVCTSPQGACDVQQAAVSVCAWPTLQYKRIVCCRVPSRPARAWS